MSPVQRVGGGSSEELGTPVRPLQSHSGDCFLVAHLQMCLGPSARTVLAVQTPSTAALRVLWVVSPAQSACILTDWRWDAHGIKALCTWWVRFLSILLVIPDEGRDLL